MNVTKYSYEEDTVERHGKPINRQNGEIYRETTCTIRINRGDSKSFWIEKGIEGKGAR